MKAPLVQAHWRTRILLRCERQCGTASALPVAARPPVSQMIAFIRCPATHACMRERGGKPRDTRGSEGPEIDPGDQFPRWTPICKALQFAPSTYYERRAIARDPDRASPRAKSDAALSLKIDGAFGGQPQTLRRPEGLARSAARRRRCRPLHRGAVDAQFGHQRRRSWQEGYHHEPGHVSAMPGRQGEPPVQGGQFKTGRPNKLCPLGVCFAKACRVTGFRLYLCAHMVGHRLRGLRDRRFRKADRSPA